MPLSDDAVAALLTWQLRQGEEREAAQEAWQTDGHVFTMEDGLPLDPAYVTRLFQKIRLAGEPLPGLTFHGLKHCAGWLWLAAGVDISIVSKLLGHSSISVTSDIYAHLFKCGRSAGCERCRCLVCSHSALTTGCEWLTWTRI